MPFLDRDIDVDIDIHVYTGICIYIYISNICIENVQRLWTRIAGLDSSQHEVDDFLRCRHPQAPAEGSFLEDCLMYCRGLKIYPCSMVPNS